MGSCCSYVPTNQDSLPSHLPHHKSMVPGLQNWQGPGILYHSSPGLHESLDCAVISSFCCNHHRGHRHNHRSHRHNLHSYPHNQYHNPHHCSHHHCNHHHCNLLHCCSHHSCPHIHQKRSYCHIHFHSCFHSHCHHSYCYIHFHSC